MAGTPPTLAQLRPALQLALEVASAGAGPLPGRVRSVVRTRRRPANWQATMRQALEDDEGFRARVAAHAEEDQLGRLAWLWLTRPDGWLEQVDQMVLAAAEADEHDREARAAAERIAALEEELARAASASQAELAAATREHEQAVAALADRLRAARAEARDRAADAEAAGQRMADLEQENAALRDRVAQVMRVVDGLRGEIAGLSDERDRAARAAERARAEKAAIENDRIRSDAHATELRGQVGAAVGRAAEAARQLGEALSEAAAALNLPAGRAATRPAVPRDAGRPVPSAPAPASAGPDTARRPARSRDQARRRRPLPLPPAVLDESPEAAAYLVRVPGAQLVVDGYNVTFTSWSGHDLPALRYRLVTALSELALRVKRRIVVIFDGADAGGRIAAPPVARPWLRILFSASSVDADRVIVETVAELSPDVPVIVVTNDRQVRADVQALGANVLSVEQLLAVLGRQPTG